MADVKKRQKYALGAAVDKELVFDFPYLSHEDTVSYIQEHGKIMFIIRGPPSTGKATLSEMLSEKYPDAAFCCADHYFKNTFGSPVRSRQTLAASHVYCKKKAKTACVNKVSTIIIQNTHMRKWEMQSYLDLAATYDYTVIMAITLYRFNVTPEALLANSTDGLDLSYFRKRLEQWEDIPPLLTGWFLSPSDTLYLQNEAIKSLQKLIGDGKFCRIFNTYDADEVAKYFRVRNIIFCLAGYLTNKNSMKDYYLGSNVQDVYGKLFKITILGYHVTCYNLNAIVKVNDEMKCLLFEDTGIVPTDIVNEMSALQLANENVFEFCKTTEFEPTTVENYTAYTEEWNEGEDIDVAQCSFIHLAQKVKNVFSIGNIRDEFKISLQSVAIDNKINDASYKELESNVKICRLREDEWLIKADKKIVIETIFTGFYP